jgi:hypothetical protein
MLVTTKRLFFLLALCALVLSSSTAFAAISFDATSGTSWWFDPANWSTHGAGAVAPYKVPPTNDGVAVTDTNLNNGWDNTGEGVVYDPVNDPFYTSLISPDNYIYPTAVDPRFDRDTIWRLYITSGAATADNKLTIKSGELEVINSPTSAGYVLIGRGGATAGLKGTLVQTGGSLLVRNENVDIGQFSTSSGNGIYDYFDGTFEAGLVTDATASKGLRLSAGNGATGRLAIHNSSSPGHFRVKDFTVGATLNTSGVSINESTVEFFANADGTRPVQVMRNLNLNHQDDTGVSGSTRSAVLKLSLDAPPAVDGSGVPINLGLFDVQGNIQGISDLFYNNTVANSGIPYNEGDLVSATFAGSTYNWTISYTGDIAWDNFDNSDVGTISGAGSGNDIVLIGYSSVVVSNPGDFDLDNDVDGADFLYWQRNPSSGNLSDWLTSYPGLQPAIAAVPEPVTGLLALGGLALLLVRRVS